MASIVDRLKKQIKAQNGDTKGIQTISQAMKALGGVRTTEDVAEVINSNEITVSEPD